MTTSILYHNKDTMISLITLWVLQLVMILMNVVDAKEKRMVQTNNSKPVVTPRSFNFVIYDTDYCYFHLLLLCLIVRLLEPQSMTRSYIL